MHRCHDECMQLIIETFKLTLFQSQTTNVEFENSPVVGHTIKVSFDAPFLKFWNHVIGILQHRLGYRGEFACLVDKFCESFVVECEIHRGQVRVLAGDLGFVRSFTRLPRYGSRLIVFNLSAISIIISQQESLFKLFP